MRELTAGESILEDLLKTQELENAQVDSWVKAETTLVRTESRVVLDTEATVDLNLTLVVLPDDTELDDALRDCGNLEGTLVLRVLLEQRAVLEGRCELCVESVSVGPSSHAQVQPRPYGRSNGVVATICSGANQSLTLVGLLELWLRWKVGHGD